MKLSIYTFITLLITLMTAPAFAEKPEGEPKRYRVILEKPTAKSAIAVETKDNTGETTQNANDESDAEHKEAGKHSKSTQKKDEKGKKWWKPWN